MFIFETTLVLERKVKVDNTKVAYALSKLFASNTVDSLLSCKKYAGWNEILEDLQAEIEIDLNQPISKLYEAAFNLLIKKQYRFEYAYKAALVNKLLLGRHSLKTAAVQTEFRVASNKADLVVFNGTSTAYEIKSERDKVDRLEGQLQSYRKVFAAVNVVCSESHLKVVSKIAPDDVGIIVLTKRFQLSSYRKTIINPQRIDPAVLLSSISLARAREILVILGKKVPNVPNTALYSEIESEFFSINRALLHKAFVATMNKSFAQSELSDLVSAAPKSLRAHMLFKCDSLKKAVDFSTNLKLPMNRYVIP